MRKKLLIINFIVLTLLAGCSFNGGSAGKSYKFGATYMTMNNPYFRDMNGVIEEMVEANGDVLIYRDPAQDQDKQNEEIEDMIAEGVSGIFLNPVDQEKVLPALKKCKEAGIPVFVVDTLVKDEDYVTFSILSDNYDAGVQCANELIAENRPVKVVVIDAPGINSMEDRAAGFMDTVKDCDNIEIVDVRHGTGVFEVAMDLMENAVDEGVDFDVIFGANDPTALGALAALQKNQIEEGILIYGIDGSPDGKVMIKEGYMVGSSAQYPLEIAEQAVEMAYDYLNGKEVEKQVIVPVTMITSDNVDDFDLYGWQ